MKFVRAVVVVAALIALPLPSEAQQQTPQEDQLGAVLIPAGTVIKIEITEALSSEENHRGDQFSLRLADAIGADGQLVANPGAVGIGEVVDARPAGSTGRPGVLVVAGRYLEINGSRVDVRWTLALGGASNTRAFPTILPYLTIGGGSAGVIPGLVTSAVLSADFRAPSIGQLEQPLEQGPSAIPEEAPDGAVEAATPSKESEDGIDPPPSGSGQVVFFRPDRNSSAIYTYTVRENDEDIASLRNGDYEVVVSTPGIHEYEIGGPFLFGRPRETLRLEVQPGDTYFVEHGIAYLAPSDPGSFYNRAHPRF